MPDQKQPLPGRSHPVMPRPASRRRSLAGLAWVAGTLLQKKIIAWQDRYGLYSYSRWIRQVEQPEINRALNAEPIQTLPSVFFLILIPDQLCSTDAVERTLSSLPAQPGANCSLTFLLPQNVQAPEWLQDLVAEAAEQPVQHRRGVISRVNWIEQVDKLPGEWFVPLAPGDRLSPHWLPLLAQAIAKTPQADLVYWDEDRITTTGRRFEPFFKPDWSPELLLSLNYLECVAFRKSLLAENRSAPGEIFALAQRARSVEHIPFVLQHRAEETGAQRQIRLEQHARAARVYLADQGYTGVEVAADGKYLRARWQVAEPLVSIIIPTKNNLEYLRRCLTSLIEKTAYRNYELVLMDDHSTDPEVQAYYRELHATPNLRIVENEPGPFNYSRVNNQGARLANGDLLLFLNNDVEIVNPDWLVELVRWVQRPGVGMVGAKLLYPDGSIQHAGIVLGMTGHANHLFAGSPPVQAGPFVSPEAYRNVSAVTGACMLVRRKVFEQVGGFDEDLALVFNDVDLGVRVLRAGCRIVYTPAATLIHYEGRSRARYIPQRDIRLGAERLLTEIERGDRYYNPNLSLAVNWPTLRRNGEPSPVSRLKKIVRNKG